MWVPTCPNRAPAGTITAHFAKTHSAWPPRVEHVQPIHLWRANDLPSRHGTPRGLAAAPPPYPPRVLPLLNDQRVVVLVLILAVDELAVDEFARPPCRRPQGRPVSRTGPHPCGTSGRTNLDHDKQPNPSGHGDHRTCSAAENGTRPPKGPREQWGYTESNCGPHPYQGCALTD